ncbi:MAG: hypothetical protein A3F74_09350 [Betaproteobacteria bacterium RIFCSPLOWO2_12_FULL_62_58]|nr:MAG: hypothetical protein A3F74_09350 [Betaproteobacteria bacterium RIFCSPLOWO2_12_FULL_62_58]
MTGNDQGKRIEKRAYATWALDVGKAKGITHDISASGMFFEMEASYRFEPSIDFEWDFDTPQGTMMLKGQGTIVRIEPRGARVGVAVKIVESEIEPVW